MTAIKIVKECHLVTTAIVESPSSSEYTTLALLLSKKKKFSYSRAEFLHDCSTSVTIFLRTFNSSDYIQFSNNDSDK